MISVQFICCDFKWKTSLRFGLYLEKKKKYFIDISFQTTYIWSMDYGVVRIRKN